MILVEGYNWLHVPLPKSLLHGKCSLLGAGAPKQTAFHQISSGCMWMCAVGRRLSLPGGLGLLNQPVAQPEGRLSWLQHLSHQ